MRLFGVAEELPLKQGLKREFNIRIIICIRVAEELPLKQGLKLDNYDKYIPLHNVAEELPLKQGLKPILFPYGCEFVSVSQRNFH